MRGAHSCATWLSLRLGSPVSLAGCRAEVLKHSCNLRGLSWWNRVVKRSLNNDLDLIPARALQAGGQRFDPGHVQQLNSRIRESEAKALDNRRVITKK